MQVFGAIAVLPGGATPQVARGRRTMPNARREAVMTPATIKRVPNQPRTPLQSFRCDRELWKAAQVKARADGTNLGAVLRAYLARYVKRK
jgi:hypothetical protein